MNGEHKTGVPNLVIAEGLFPVQRNPAVDVWDIPTDTRPGWTEVFLKIADTVALRATCPRLSCGAVITTRDHQILTTGYNGAPYGMQHCFDIGCAVEDGHCVRSVHAEMNAVLLASRIGTRLEGGVLYATNRPCIRCTIALIQAGVSEVHYSRPYTNDRFERNVMRLFEEAGIDVHGPYCGTS